VGVLGQFGQFIPGAEAKFFMDSPAASMGPLPKALLEFMSAKDMFYGSELHGGRAEAFENLLMNNSFVNNFYTKPKDILFPDPKSKAMIDPSWQTHIPSVMGIKLRDIDSMNARARAREDELAEINEQIRERSR
jgi:hypothetical protein